ncbi:MAG: hypothetical protein KDB01_01990 [Planctomycetaceae bacterium]|nr:hypothetical protein [Planctomycetaceae bacterium]
MQIPTTAGKRPPESPDLIVGAGSLTSYVWRIEHQQGEYDYRFDLISHSRPGEHSGLQLFAPKDLPDMLAWMNVLIRELLHDGWLNASLRTELRRLLVHLQEIPEVAACDSCEEEEWPEPHRPATP